MFMTIVYVCIAVILFVSVLYNLIVKEEKITDKINAAMILIPLILRILMIK